MPYLGVAWWRLIRRVSCQRGARQCPLWVGCGLSERQLTARSGRSKNSPMAVIDDDEPAESVGIRIHIGPVRALD